MTFHAEGDEKDAKDGIENLAPQKDDFVTDSTDIKIMTVLKNTTSLHPKMLRKNSNSNPNMSKAPKRAKPILRNKSVDRKAVHDPLHTINQAQKTNRKSDISISNREHSRGTSFLSKLTNKFSRR